MALSPPVSELSRLNLPPLKVDGEGKINSAQLAHFTRTIAEWGQRVDELLENLADEVENLELDGGSA